MPTMEFGNKSANPTEIETLRPTPLSCRTQVSFGKDYEKFEYIINVYVITILIILGLVGNVISFVILKHMKQATVILLLRALAAIDSIYLLTCLGFQSFRTLFMYSDSFSRFFWYYPHVFVVMWPVASMAQSISVWMVVLVTFDRYDAICHAMATTKYMTKTKVRIYIGIVILGSICFNLPTVFDVRVVDRRPFCSNINKIDTFVTAFYQDPIYDLIYKTILTIIFRVALPVFIVIILNFLILYQVKKSEEFRAGIVQRASNGIRSINVMIGTVTFVYVICELPDLTYRVLRVIKFYNPDFLMAWDQFAYFAQVSNLFLTINSSTNFLWYCLAGTKFRETLKCKVCGAGRGGFSSSTILTLSSSRRAASSIPTSSGTPLIMPNPKRPHLGTPQIFEAGKTPSRPAPASLTTHRTLYGSKKHETVLIV